MSCFILFVFLSYLAILEIRPLSLFVFFVFDLVLCLVSYVLFCVFVLSWWAPHTRDVVIDLHQDKMRTIQSQDKIKQDNREITSLMSNFARYNVIRYNCKRRSDLMLLFLSRSFPLVRFTSLFTTVMAKGGRSKIRRYHRSELGKVVGKAYEQKRQALVQAKLRKLTTRGVVNALPATVEEGTCKS